MKTKGDFKENTLHLGIKGELGLPKHRAAHHRSPDGRARWAASAGTSRLIGEGSQILAEAHEETDAADTPNLGLLCGYRPSPWMGPPERC